MTEAYASLSNIIKYYGKVENGKIVNYGAQIPFNFRLMVTNMQSKASDFVKPITDFINSMPKGKHIHANWLVCITFSSKFLLDLNFLKFHFFYLFFKLGNHDQIRLASRFSSRRVDIFNILLKTLPGITITYNVIRFLL